MTPAQKIQKEEDDRKEAIRLEAERQERAAKKLKKEARKEMDSQPREFNDKDIEEPKPDTPPESTPPPKAPHIPHGSGFTYLVMKKKGIQAAAMFLRGPQGKGQWVIAFALFAGVGIAAGIVGVQIYNAANPPLQVLGVCPPPAYVSNGGCYRVQPEIITVSGVASATEVTVTAGTEYLPTQTNSNGGG